MQAGGQRFESAYLHQFSKIISAIYIDMKNKILIVDDNYAQFTQDLIEEEIDAKFDLAYNGLEGLEKFQQNSLGYSLIVMDLNMPVMNGIESIKKIREIDAQIPIIVHSSMCIEKIINESIAAGGNVFVQKGSIDLIREVKEWLP